MQRLVQLGKSPGINRLWLRFKIVDAKLLIVGKLSKRERLHEIIFENDTKAGKAFDVTLITIIIISVSLIMIDSIPEMHNQYGEQLLIAEWFFTILFTIEFILRLTVIRQPLKYIFSFFGIVDLLAILPTYLSFVFPGGQSLLVIRVFRLLRIFRVFKLGNYVTQADVLKDAFIQSRQKIIVFLMGVLAIVMTMGTLMYVIEGEKNGFTSIPRSIYWSIVTMTTVGFGDITPKTPLGQFLASVLMIVGYGVIAVPTGIVTTELLRHSQKTMTSGQACPNCGSVGHDIDAKFCKYCAAKL